MSNGWAATRRWSSTRGSSPPPTRASRTPCAAAPSAAICIIAFACCRSSSRPFGNIRKTCRAAGDMLLKRAAAARRDAPSLTRDAAAALRDYAWPGNVRELRHAIERASIPPRGRSIGLDPSSERDPQAPRLEADRAPARRPTLDEVERRYIAATLHAARGNQTEAARLLGISRKALWEKRKRYGLE